MTARTPQPGEWWESNLIGGVVLRTETGWAWPNGEPLSHPGVVRPVGDGPVAYSADVVDRLRAELAESRKLARELHAAEAERDAALARVEELDAELATEREKVRFPGLVDVARDEPWRVLRAAADVMHPEGLGTGLWTHEERTLRTEADRLERECAEKARRDRLIDVAMDAADGLHDRVAFGAVVDAVLAEAGDPQ